MNKGMVNRAGLVANYVRASVIDRIINSQKG